MKDLFKQHTEFTLATFPEATSESSLIKCEGEINEIREQLRSDTLELGVSLETAEEHVDGVMCLFDSAARAGITGEMFEEAFKAKLAKNKARTWVKNADNTYSHVKQ